MLQKVQRMQDDMAKYEKDKFSLFRNLRDNEEMAKHKIGTLQQELDSQNNFFKMQEEEHAKLVEELQDQIAKLQGGNNSRTDENSKFQE